MSISRWLPKRAGVSKSRSMSRPRGQGRRIGHACRCDARRSYGPSRRRCILVLRRRISPQCSKPSASLAHRIGAPSSEPGIHDDESAGADADNVELLSTDRIVEGLPGRPFGTGCLSECQIAGQAGWPRHGYSP
jgi:hypothetical protein